MTKQEQPSSTPKSFLKFLLLRLMYASSRASYRLCSAEEQALAGKSMFAGRCWPLLVIEELERNGDPLSEAVKAEILSHFTDGETSIQTDTSAQ